MLFPLAKPRFSRLRMSFTAGNSRSTTSGVPSEEALSPTMSSTSEQFEANWRLFRQSLMIPQLFQVTTTTDTRYLASRLIEISLLTHSAIGPSVLIFDLLGDLPALLGAGQPGNILWRSALRLRPDPCSSPGRPNVPPCMDYQPTSGLDREALSIPGRGAL